jgi:hypothetical protein
MVIGMAAVLFSGSLFAADPFVGTWKLNLAQSKPAPVPPGMTVKEQTFVIQAIGERYAIAVNSTMENGSIMTSQYSVPVQGGPITYSDVARSAGTSVAMKRINDNTIEIVTTRDKKVVASNRITVEANGKTMRDEENGVDAQGKAIQALYVSDKQ